MTDYKKLVDDLRDIGKTMFALGTTHISMDNVSISLAYDKGWGQTANDAAAAIEALQAENADIREELFISQRKYDEFTTIASMQNAMLAKQLPKRGKWIIHPEVKNIYGGVYIECPFCGEKYVVQNVSDEKFCRNCGADLRARMEVQDGKQCD